MTELQILTAIRNNQGHISFTGLLNQNLTESKPDPRRDKVLIKQLIKSGHIAGCARAYGTLTLTDAGFSRLEHLKKESNLNHEQEQLRKKDYKQQLKIAAFASLGAILSDPLWEGIRWVVRFIWSTLS